MIEERDLNLALVIEERDLSFASVIGERDHKVGLCRMTASAASVSTDVTIQRRSAIPAAL